MMSLQTASIPFLLVIGFVYCEIGHYCVYRSDCTRGFMEEQDCIDSYCTCKSGYDLEYSSSLTAYCEDPTYRFLRKRCTIDRQCPEHNVCREPANRCDCEDGAVKVGKKCKKVLKFSSVLESCREYSHGVHMCNLEEKSICKSGKCVCFQKYFANTTSGKCEPYSNYIKVHGLSTYRVKPGEYCYSSGDCIEGLTCSNFKCSCPSGCTYVASKTICDCGAVPTPIGPVLLGIFLGFIILGCWMYKINKTYEHFRAKKGSRQFTSIPLDNQDAPSPPRPRYNLNPSRSSDSVESSGFSAQSHPPVGLSVNNPVPTGSGRQSPVPPNQVDPLPSKPYSFNNMTDYPLNPTQDTPHPANPSQATPYPVSAPVNPIQDTPYPADPSQATPYPISAPVMNPYGEDSPQPPPYSAVPLDPPPPYSLFPPSSGSAPPLPYPISAPPLSYPLGSTDPPNISTSQPPNLYTAPYPPTPHTSATPGSADGQPVPPPYNPTFSGTTGSSGPNY